EVHNTTLAFVALSESGDRSFSFYRRFGADAMLTTADVDPEPIRSASYFHFGSLSLTNSASREATAHALELAKRSITVNCVAPGVIETDMTKDLPFDEVKKLIPLRRFGKPEEVAGAVSFLMGPDAAYITRQVISVNGGLI
ncbi:MAG: SDR family oxidoreductase, partial [Opitutales bacterium]|nr:SDR family oxidoreductase [Opitutales bacterium]